MTLFPSLSIDQRLGDLRACQCGGDWAPTKHHHTYFRFCHPNPERLWCIMICNGLGDIGTAPMMGPGDAYRLRAADMLAKAEQNQHHREDFENLAMAYLRLAEQADRNAKLANRLGRTTLPPIKSSSRYNSNSNTRPKIKPRIEG